MAFPSSSHQARVVALSCTTERNGVSSWANLIISTRYLWVTLSLSGHHTRTVAFNSSFKHERKKEWKNNGLGKSSFANEGATHPLQRHPWMRHYNPLYVMNPMPVDYVFLTTSSTLHGLERDHLETLLDLGKDLPNKTPHQPSHIQAWKFT